MTHMTAPTITLPRVAPTDLLGRVITLADSLLAAVKDLRAEHNLLREENARLREERAAIEAALAPKVRVPRMWER